MGTTTKKALKALNPTPKNGCVLVATSYGKWKRGASYVEASEGMRGDFVVYVIEGTTEAWIDEDGFFKRKPGSKVLEEYFVKKGR